MVSWLAPGPWIVRFLVMASSPLVSVIVWPTRLGEKTMVSPLWAAAISARRVPAPVSLALVTVSVLGSDRSSSASSCGRKLARCRRDVGVRRRAAGAERFQFRSQEENNMIVLLSSAGLR